MTIQELIKQMELNGIAIEPAGDQLNITALRGALTKELKQLISQHKPALLKRFRGRWVDPEVAELMATAPADAWPLVLYADSGATPVWFNTPAELMAATKRPGSSSAGRVG